MERGARSIGPYRVLEPLGRGGMGIVYRAVHRDSGQVVALKTVVVPDEWALASLRREIRALARIHHPQVVHILDEGVQDGLPWYAMELLEGTTLRRFAARLFGRSEALEPSQAAPMQALDAGASAEADASALCWWTRSLQAPGGTALSGEAETAAHRAAQHAAAAEPGTEAPRTTLPVAAGGRLGEVLTLVRSLCVPLSFLHGEGIVHRDLKFDNILLRGSGIRDQAPTPVIVDFGLVSRFGGPLSREALEVFGSGSGTVASMAPEQILGELVDARADLYALGCILYELLTGWPPFVGPAPAAVLYGHLREAARPPAELASAVPEELDALVLRLLAKDPRERLGYADDVAAALVALESAQSRAPSLESSRFAARLESRVSSDEPSSLVAVHDPRLATGDARLAPKARAYLYRPGLAGRHEVLEQLGQRLGGLAQGTGGLVFLGGESGVGKTRLAMELAREAERRKLFVATGECAPPAAATHESSAGSGGGPLHPLHPVLQRIADRCREGGLAETDRLLGRRGRLLALYEPALRGLPGQEAYPEPAGLPAKEARLCLYRDLTETLGALAGAHEEHPPSPPADGSAALLLLLDDLQWADDLTLGFLEFLSKGSAECLPILILATYRTEEAGAGLKALLELPGATPMKLGRLGEDAVGSMIGDMLALRPVPGAFVRFLTRQSEGNPFFIAEYLRTAVAEGLLYRDAAGHWQVREPAAATASETVYDALPLPGSLRELVGRRLAGLSPGAWHIAQAASVLGREIDFALLEELLSPQDAAALEAVQELLARQVLEEISGIRLAGPAPSSDWRLRFVHDKLREGAYERIEAEPRRQLHRGAAQALEARLGARLDEYLPVLAEHWHQAGVLDKAREYYLAAGRRMASRYAYQEAERLYQSYLALVDKPSAESIRARNELGFGVLRSEGRLAQALSEHRLALEEARRLGERELEAQSLHRLGVSLWEQGRLTEAQTPIEQGLAIARAFGNRKAEESFLDTLAVLRKVQGFFDEARGLYEQALGISRALGNRSSEGATLSNLALLHASQGRRVEARALYEQALALRIEVDDRRGVGIVKTNLGLLCFQQGQLEQASAFYEQALAIHREVGNRSGEGYVLAELACLQSEQGHIEEARELFERSLVLYRQVGSQRFEGATLCDKAVLERRTGNLAEAQELLQRAQELLQESSDAAGFGQCLCQHGHTLLASQSQDVDTRTAAASLAQARELAARLSAGAESSLGQAICKLERAIAGVAAGQRLFRGECIEDLPAGLRQWLIRTAQLDASNGKPGERRERPRAARADRQPKSRR